MDSRVAVKAGGKRFKRGGGSSGTVFLRRCRIGCLGPNRYRGNVSLQRSYGSPESKSLLRADAAELHPSGYLFFTRQGALLAQRLDGDD